MSLLEAAAATATMALGSLVQGVAGFGLALVTAPPLTLLDPVLVPGPIMASALLLTGLMAWRDRGEIHFAGIGWVYLGRLPGTALGAVAVATLPTRGLGLLIGAAVLLAVAMVASGRKLRPTPATLAAAGLVSGVMGTASAIGGPPLAMVYLESGPGRLRGTLAGNFLLGTATSLAALALVGRFGPPELAATGLLLPGVVAGYLLSNRALRTLDRERLRRAVLLLSTAGGLAVIARSLL